MALGHAREAQCVGPAADSGEEMALREAAQLPPFQSLALLRAEVDAPVQAKPEAAT